MAFIDIEKTYVPRLQRIQVSLIVEFPERLRGLPRAQRKNRWTMEKKNEVEKKGRATDYQEKCYLLTVRWPSRVDLGFLIYGFKGGRA